MKIHDHTRPYGTHHKEEDNDDDDDDEEDDDAKCFMYIATHLTKLLTHLMF